MRTTVDLPDHVLQQLRHIAADRRTSVSKVIADFVVDAVDPARPARTDRISVDPVSGLKSLDIGRAISTEDVRRAMEDE